MARPGSFLISERIEYQRKGRGDMSVMKGQRVRSATVPSGLIRGVLVSAFMTLLAAAGIAMLIGKGLLKENGIGCGVMFTVITASFAGSILTGGTIKRSRLLLGLTSGGVYFCLLLVVNAMVFEGEYSGVFPTALLVLCGSMLGILPGLREKRVGKRPKIKLSNR